jgi:thioredoxin reductase (NADPH)
MEAQLCAGEEVVVVGGGNSAGQAAAYLSQTVSKVHMLIRGKSLSSSMSKYLVERIQASPKINVYYETEITSLSGKKTLEFVEWKNSSTGESVKKPIRTLFVMIGAIPNTEWLKKCTALDSKGFVLTGKTKAGNPFETGEPGVFAVGDVRSDSVKRVASAVGEGSVVIQWVHQYLYDLNVKKQKEKNSKKAA